MSLLDSGYGIEDAVGCRPDVEVGQSQRQADVEQKQVRWQLSKGIHQLQQAKQMLSVTLSHALGSLHWKGYQEMKHQHSASLSLAAQGILRV